MTSNKSQNRQRRLRGRRPIGLALQGGGSWGAYTWGVLDALLASRTVFAAQLSGTSAGAINAAIVASALAKGSPALARRALRSFWRCIADPAAADLLRNMWGPLGRTWQNSLGDWLLASGTIGAYGANALSVHTLRDAVSAHVDIDAIRSKWAPALFVTMTNAKTGLPRVIANAQMSVDVLLASACLPHLFPAVQIDGEHYWDGGYAGNPTLWPLIKSGLADDLILVQLAPDRIEDVPVDAPSIRRRVSDIVFNASLGAEMRALTAIRGLIAQRNSNQHIIDLRLHRIGPPRNDLREEGTSLDRGRVWLDRLHEEGMAAGKQFLATHGADIGVRETLDVAGTFMDAHNRSLRAPSDDQAGGKGDDLKSLADQTACSR